MDKLNSIKIMGESSISGGIYNKVTILGDAFSRGKIDCTSVKIIGGFDMKDELICEKMNIVGTAVSNNKLVVREELKIVGDLNSSEVVEAGRVKIVGEGRFQKDLKFHQVDLVGELSVKGNCEGTTFFSRGTAIIDGLLSADTVEIIPDGISTINEIGGSEITIRKKRWISFSRGKVISNTIEGDNILLENTHCKVVCGHNITILGGCIIDKIEYTGTLTVDSSSRVGEQICLKN